MSNISLEQLLNFLASSSGVRQIRPGSDLFKDHGIVGDDFHELIEAYANRFGVDMSAYRWYFHADEEGLNFGSLFYKPPYARVERIPVTPLLLLEFANKGKWDLAYPEHRLPKWRPDLVVTNVLIFVVLAALLVYYMLG